MSTPDSQAKPFWTPRMQAAAGVVAVIVVAAIVLAVVNLTGRAPTSGPGLSASAVPTMSITEADGCPELSTDVGSGIVTEAPKTTWTLVGRMAAPLVEDQGPAVIDADGWRHCYARTPTGALVAAANYVAMTEVPELIARLAEDGIMPGDLRDRAIATPAMPSASTTTMQLRGFRVVSFTTDMAVVDLAVEIQGKIGSMMITLRWYQGDWRLGVRGAGATQELDIDYGNLPSFYGYVAWAGA